MATKAYPLTELRVRYEGLRGELQEANEKLEDLAREQGWDEAWRQRDRADAAEEEVRRLRAVLRKIADATSRSKHGFSWESQIAQAALNKRT